MLVRPAVAGRCGLISLMRTRAGRLVIGGLLGTLAVGASGLALERGRFGSSDDEALSRVEAEFRRQFDGSADALGAMAARVAAERAGIRTAMRDPAAAARLFDIVSGAIPSDQAGRTGITIYDTADRPLAWAGRVSDLAKQRVSGAAALFVAPGALGPRLVRVEPVVDPDRPGSLRDATIVVEQSLAGLQPTPGLAADTAVVSTSLAPVTIHTQFDGPGTAGDRRLATGNYAFVIPSRTGGLLVEAEVSRADLTEARARWRARTWAACGVVLVLTLGLCAGPLLDVRRRARTATVFLAATAAVAVIVLAARASLLWVAVSVAGPQPFGSPANALLTGLAAAALVALAVDLLMRRRVAKPRPRFWLRRDPDAISDYRVAAVYFVTGALAALTLLAYQAVLQRIVGRTDLDVLHFSLHPFSIPGLEVGFGLLLLHAAVIWAAAMATHAGGVFWRRPRRWDLRATAMIGWLAGAAGTVAVISARTDSIPLVPWCVSIAVSGACAAAFARLSRRSRRASQTARLVALFAALAVPALAMYPSLFFYATEAKERLVATTFAPQAMSQRDDLQDRLYQTLEQIDAMPTLADFVAGPSASAAPTTDRAFVVWSHTELATYRLTSAVELYGPDGGLVSRFALPAGVHDTPSRASELQLGGLRRGVAVRVERTPRPAGQPRHLRGRRRRGAIVVRVMLDYRTLPFISSQSPYLESLRPERGRSRRKGVSGRDVEFVVYGWSRAPLYASGTSVWPLPDDAFRARWSSRASRSGTTLTRGGDASACTSSTTAAASTRSAIRSITWFGHLMNLAELVMLTGVLYVAPARRRDAVQRADVASRRPAAARCCARCARASTASCSSRSWPAPSCRSSILAIADADLLRDAVRGPASRKPRRRRPPSRSGWSRTTRRCSSAAPAALDADRRPDHGARRPRHRSGRQPLRSRRSCRRRASATCSRRSCCPTRTPGRRLSAASCSIGCRPSSAIEDDRRLPLSAGGRARPRRRPRGHRHRAADAPAAGDRAADRRARSAACCRRPCCSSCSGRRSATGWPSGSPIR